MRRVVFKRLKIKNTNKVYSTISKTLTAITALILIMPALAAANSTTSSLPFTDPNNSSSDNFGQAISLSQDGNTALVTANEAPDNNGNAGGGTAYVYVNSNGSWSEVAQLSPNPNTSSMGTNYEFGSSGAISQDGTEIIIGAIDAINAEGVQQGGAAYVFNEPAGGWGSTGPILQSSIELDASNSQQASQFGISVGFSADDSTAIVGADHYSSGSNSDVGDAYIFNEPAGGWNGGYETESTILNPLSGGTDNLFGLSVALSSDGSSALVGAPGQGPDTTLPGYAVQYSEPTGGWSSSPTLSNGNVITSRDGVAYDLFGSSVNITSNGNTAVIGAPGREESGLDEAGAAYTFVNNGTNWTQAGEISAPDPTQFADYGRSIALSPSGTTILIGSPAHQDNTTDNYNVGEVYEYGLTNGVPGSIEQSFLPATNTAQQDFGWSVAIVNNQAEGNIFIGAPGLTAVPTQPDGGNASIDLKTLTLKASSNDSSSGVVGAAYLFDTVPPVIAGVSPSHAGAGEQLTITGQHLLPTFNPNAGSVSVGFNKGKLLASIVSDSETQITVVVPNGAKNDPIEVTTPNGKASSFSYVVGPSITSISPTSQGEGDAIKIKGVNLSGATATINGLSLHIVSAGAKSVTADLPANATSGYITLNTPNGGSTVFKTSIIVLAPQITSVPKSATVGSTITIKGSDLDGVTQVQFGGNVIAYPKSTSDSSVTVVVPSGAMSGPIAVLAPSGSGTSKTSLSI